MLPLVKVLVGGKVAAGRGKLDAASTARQSDLIWHCFTLHNWECMARRISLNQDKSSTHMQIIAVSASRTIAELSAAMRHDRGMNKCGNGAWLHAVRAGGSRLLFKAGCTDLVWFNAAETGRLV
eukprot:scaffold149740_cov39-Prasinocladus_malaysianus.AAC.1